MTIDHKLIVVRDQSAALIREEVRSMRQRELLEKAVRDAVIKLGCSVDEVSDASGLTPSDIYEVLDSAPADDNLAALAGIG